MWQESFTTYLIYYAGLDRWYWMTSSPNLRCSVDWNRSEKMLFGRNLKCYVDCTGCDRKPPRPMWSTMWIRTDVLRRCHDLIRGALWIGADVKECCHDLIWSAMWIGIKWHEAFSTNLNFMWIWTDDRGWCLDQIESAMWIGKDVKGTFLDKFEIIYALHQTWKNADMT
jgi:hypothetical protein